MIILNPMRRMRIDHVILVFDNVVLQAKLVLLFVLLLLEAFVFARHLDLWPLECPWYQGKCLQWCLLDTFELFWSWGFAEWWTLGLRHAQNKADSWPMSVLGLWREQLYLLVEMLSCIEQLWIFFQEIYRWRPWWCEPETPHALGIPY